MVKAEAEVKEKIDRGKGKEKIDKEVIMPGGDRTGPSGKGPRTGRGLGPCGTTEKQLEDNRGLGRGLGRGPGRGLGLGRGRGRRRGPNGITYFT